MDGWRGRRIIKSPSLIADYHRLGVRPTWWLVSDVSVITALKILTAKGLALNNMDDLDGSSMLFPKASHIPYCFLLLGCRDTDSYFVWDTTN